VGLWLYEPVVPAAHAPHLGNNPLATGARRRRPSFDSHEAALANFASKPPLNVARADALHAYVRHGLVAGEDGAAHLACRPEDEARLYEGSAAHGAYEHLAEVQCPVVVACSAEPVGPARWAVEAADALPQGRLEVFEHLTHFGPLESPAELAASVRAFAETI
jgi:pimeloyl-ACP methyl ester carboxylesterase